MIHLTSSNIFSDKTNADVSTINHAFFKDTSQVLKTCFLIAVAYTFGVAIYKSPYLAIYGIFLMFVGLLTLVRPFTLFLSYIALVPFLQAYRFFTKDNIFAIDALKDGIFILIVLVWIANFLLKTHNPLRNINRGNRFNLIMLIFMSYMLMQVFRVSSMTVGILGFREVVEFMFAFFLAQFFFRTEGQVKKCIQIIFISGLVVALIGILQQIIGMHYTTKTMHIFGSKIYRLSSTIGNPNTLGFFLVIAILISIYNFFSKPITKFRYYFLLFSMVPMLVCLFFSYSRTSLIALGVGIVTMSAMKKNIKLLIISVILTVPIFLSMSSEMVFRYKGIIHGLDPGRRLMWNLAWEQFRQNPVIGVGYGKVGGLYLTGRGVALGEIIAESTGYISVVDSSYFFLLNELGIIGFCLFCLLLILIFKKGWILIKELKSPYLRQLSICLFSILTALSLGALSANIFGMVFPINFYFWLLAGIMVNLQNIDLNLERENLLRT